MAISQELLTASQTASKNYGIPQEVILGFAGVETSYGTAGVGKTKNNVFGIMNADGSAKSYNSITESVEDFAKLVTGNKDSSQSKKYGEATSKATTTEEWVNAIRDSGYNSEYADGVYEGRVMVLINTLKNGILSDSLTTGAVDKLTLDNSDFTLSEKLGLKWWGDVVVVVVAILLIVGAVVFLGLGVTTPNTRQNATQKFSLASKYNKTKKELKDSKEAYSKLTDLYVEAGKEIEQLTGG